MASSRTDRIHGFDVLRSVAMWLGVLLHALIVYKATPEPNWPVDQSAGYIALDELYRFIHLFRMPLFYLVAGFFTGLVLKEKGVVYFVKQRYKRIFIPFVVSLFTILPASLFPFHFYRFFYEEHHALGEAMKLSSVQMFKWNGLAHLWFLYYLLFFYVVSLLLFSGYMLNSKIKAMIKYTFERTLNYPWLLLSTVFILLFLILSYNNITTPVVYTGIRPNLIYLQYYGLFFGTGMLMFYLSKTVHFLQKTSMFFLLAGFVMSLWPFAGSHVYTAAHTLLLVFGFTGFFIRFFNKESAWWRYFSDSSYWVYLIHLFFVAFLQIAFLKSGIPPFLKMPLVLTISLAVSLTSYHLFVRYSFIGEILHGERIKTKMSS